MTTRQTNALVLLAVLVAAGVLFWTFGRGEGGAAGGSGVGAKAAPLDAVPAETFLVATLDVAKLRASPLAAPLTPLVRRLGAMAEAPRACGFDPLDRLTSIAVAVPEAEDSGDFGVAMQGDVARDDLAACAQKVVAARGGSAEIVADGAWAFVEDRAATASLARRLEGGRLALHDGGPFLLGRGAWLDAMRQAVEGKHARVATNARHEELRAALGADGDGNGAALAVTALLPASVRDRIRNEMGDEKSGKGVKQPSAAMDGVLGVSAAGVSLAFDGATTDLRAELRCDTETACREVEELVETKRAAAQKDLGLRLVGIGAVLDALVVERHGAALSARARVPTDDARRVVEALLSARDDERAASGPAMPSPRAGAAPDAGFDASATHPDEVVRPRDAGRRR